MTKFDPPSLPLDLEIIDAKGVYNALRSYEELFVTYANGKYWFKTRIIGYGTDWDTHFQVTLDQAREIIRLGYASWWINVDHSVR